jgi:3-hydroxybutyryl-CoA dehydrogenase
MSIAIVGAGAMGRGIAQLLAQSNHPVLLFDNRPGAADEAITSLRKTWETLAEKGRLKDQTPSSLRLMLTAVKDLRALAGAKLVIEAIAEDLSAKQALFASLEDIVGPHTVFATNTSSLSVTAIASACKRPQRVAGLHFFNPVPLMRVVEVVQGLRTNAQVVEDLVKLIKGTGHEAVRCSDTPGFIVNHAGRGYGTEALSILRERVTDVSTIDRILRDQCGFRLGPFELMDLTALDVSHPVMESIYAQYYGEPRYRPSPITAQRLAAGMLGRKTQTGFYSYQDTAKIEQKEPGTIQLPLAVPSIFIAETDKAQATQLRALLSALNLQESATQTPDTLNLIAPLGFDATHIITAFYPALAKRSLAIDLLMPDAATKRRVLMTTPVTDPHIVPIAQALFAGDGKPVSVIQDSAGFVTQRVMATIINIACDMCQQGITSPQELDRAVMLGLGYPQGPLAWGDAIGAKRIVQVLSSIHDITQDPRYRVSPWLARRAKLGLALTSVDASIAKPL